jgi:hypothetical protein
MKCCGYITVFGSSVVSGGLSFAKASSVGELDSFAGSRGVGWWIYEGRIYEEFSGCVRVSVKFVWGRYPLQRGCRRVFAGVWIGLVSGASGVGRLLYSGTTPAHSTSRASPTSRFKSSSTLLLNSRESSKILVNPYQLSPICPALVHLPHSVW